MLRFPNKAFVGRIMPKEAFFKQLTLSREVRDKFVSDVKRITLEYKLSSNTINVESASEISEILILSVDLKKPELDYRIIESIARQNPHKLLFLIKYEDSGHLALYSRKLYITEWMSLGDLELETRGFNLDKIWEGFIEQIALVNQESTLRGTELSIEERLKRQEVIVRLQKEIDKLERLSRNEKQSKKRFELYTELQDLKKILVQIQRVQ